MPSTLFEAGVPTGTWFMIYTLIEEELLPVSLNCFRAIEQYNIQMKNYELNKGKNNWKVAEHGRMQTEKIAHMQGVQTGIFHNNVTLVATALKDRVSLMLAKYISWPQ